MGKLFHQISKHVSNWMGHPLAFVAATTIIILWALSGPAFGYSDTWQLVINTATTIVTFLMVFLIQNTQNRDTRALQLKLDELIRASAQARNKLIDLEELSDEEMDDLHQEFCELKNHYEDRLNQIQKHRHKKHKGHKQDNPLR